MAERPRRPAGPSVGSRKLVLAALVFVAAWGLARVRGGPAGAVPEGADPSTRVAAALSETTGRHVEPATLQLMPLADGPLGVGAPTAAYFVARAEAGGAGDVHRAVLRLAEDGTPLVLDAVTNLTRTADGDEQLLDVTLGCVLYANAAGGRQTGAVLLDFERPQAELQVGTVVGALSAITTWQAYGTFEPPARYDVVLAAPARKLTGRCTETGAVLTVDEHVVLTLDRNKPSIEPADGASLLVGGRPPLEALSLLADTLRSSDVVGTARVVALEAALFDLQDWLARTRHGLFPSSDDGRPVAAPFRLPAAKVTGWPPGPLSVPTAEAASGEGEWTSPIEAPAGEADGPPVLRTFVRVDPERPYERVYLFAFDMRRLGLHFIGGTSDPRSTTGARGRGTIAPGHRSQVIATFNGGFKAEHGAFGAVEDARVIVPPSPGLATVALDANGRARFGVWDQDGALPPDVVGLRQNLPPLLAAGVVNPQRMHNWGQLVSRLDASQTPRSALGVTDGGVLVLGWARATSAELLGEAMRRAGVQFALHLDMNPAHTGLELYTGDPADPVAVRGADEMDFRERRWLGTDARDFFYLTRTPREQRGLSEPQDLGVATPEGPDAPVRLWRLDAVRPQSIPGLAEPAPTTRDGPAPRIVKLPAAPVFWMDAGVRPGGASGFGLVVGGRIWRAPVPGELTLMVDAEGAPRLDVWPEGGDATRFPELLQAPALLRAGAIVAPAGPLHDPFAAPDAHTGAEHPDGSAEATMPKGFVALGQDAQRRLLVAAGTGTTPAGMATALRDAGAVDALWLTGKTTAESGRVRFFQLIGDKLFQSDRPLGRKEPADLRPRAGGVLVFTARPTPARARVVQSFRTEAR